MVPYAKIDRCTWDIQQCSYLSSAVCRLKSKGTEYYSTPYDSHGCNKPASPPFDNHPMSYQLSPKQNQPLSRHPCVVTTTIQTKIRPQPREANSLDYLPFTYTMTNHAQPIALLVGLIRHQRLYEDENPYSFVRLLPYNR